jgi:hypothetical protein
MMKANERAGGVVEQQYSDIISFLTVLPLFGSFSQVILQHAHE